MTPLRILLLAAAVILAGAIAWAAMTASFGASFALITANPWGVVTLIDLYAAFLVAAVVIWRFEPPRPLAAVLILLTLVLGSLVPLLWLAFRAGPALVGRVSAS